MLKSLFFFGLTGCTLFFAACGNEAEKANVKLNDEVMSLHDEIMPLMGGFTRKSIQIDTLLTRMDSLKTADPALDTLAKRTELAALKLKLDEANDAMTDWMQEFEPDNSGRPAEEVRKYLEGEKAKLIMLKKQFEAAKVAMEGK